MKKLLLTGSALLLVGTAAQAESLRDRVVRDLTAQGFQRIEIKRGLTQMKFEATKGNQTVELVYDRFSGDLLKRETEAAEADDRGEGFKFRTVDRDFVGDRSREDDDDRDDDDDDDRDDHDDDRDDDDHDGDDDHDDDDDDHDDDDDDDDDDDEDDDEDDD
ncbi:hypothetical protein PSA7680_03421 [Pseudoruegeria aquimaris]|uniref:PepSY domain-containing protein n=1 Tax=Pseudoruegeria aquimaris TaxID=393663 RepID=A0A1Y5TIM6_9RHOB|nr:hypothetical protein [Pseudoruegeria aquimaris]SLN64783.1 hypothetical protein PSA7680_03421 [Pseudoruegeria aquimaris]